jgi:hypothetical protein
MSIDLKDYPSIDIMNHLLEIRRDLAGNPFAFRGGRAGPPKGRAGPARSPAAAAC